MPQIPQAIDYGGRPSLQTNRVDRPSGGNVLVADALVSAASEFKQVMDQKQAKEDRLNYSLARNEIQQADLENRAALSEDQEWATHDERYSTGFSTARDEILSRYSLSPADKAVMASESNLIHAQGRVAVGEGARRLEVDESVERYEIGQAKARAALPGLDQASRVNVVFGQLDAIEAMVESGSFSNEKGQAEREAMTQDFARSTLDAMPVKERILALEQTLAYRKSYGGIGKVATDGKYASGEGPFDAEAIRNGEGTGSIADFLHADTVAQMLDRAKGADEIDDARENGAAASDAAHDKYPNLTDQKAREKMIREMTSGRDREEALSMSRRRQSSESNANNEVTTELMNSLSDDIANGRAFFDIPSDVIKDLSPTERGRLEALAIRYAEGDGHGEFTVWEDYYRWTNMSPIEKSKQNLDGADWKPYLTRHQAEIFAGEQANIRNSLEGDKPIITYKGDTDDEVLANALIGSGRFESKPKAGTPEAARWARIDSSYDNALKQLSQEKIDAGKRGELTPKERSETMSEILTREVFIRADPTGPDFLYSNESKREARLLVGLNPEEIKEVFVPMSTLTTKVEDVDGMGNPIMADQFIRNLGVDLENISDADIEEAYFYYQTYGEAAAIARLKKTEGY